MEAATMTPEVLSELMYKSNLVDATPVRFIISSAVLERNVKALLSVVSNNPILPILECIMISVTSEHLLTLTTSNLSRTITCDLPIEVLGAVPGTSISFAVNAKRFYKLIKSLPEQPITIAFDGNRKATVHVDSGYYNFYAELGQDWPKMATLDNAQTIKNVNAKELIDALGKTLPFTSNDDLRPAMTGVYFDENYLVATDGHRLVRVQVDRAIAEQGFILPYEAGNLFLKAYGKSDAALTIDVSKTNLRFSWANFTLITRIIDERFPDYKNALPVSGASQVIVSRTALLRLISRVELFTNLVMHQISITATNGKILVKAVNLDESEDCAESMIADTLGENIEIGFNCVLLSHTLKNMPGSHVQILMSSANRAAVMHPHDGEPDTRHLSLIMPVMLNTYA